MQSRVFLIIAILAARMVEVPCCATTVSQNGTAGTAGANGSPSGNGGNGTSGGNATASINDVDTTNSAFANGGNGGAGGNGGSVYGLGKALLIDIGDMHDLGVV